MGKPATLKKADQMPPITAADDPVVESNPSVVEAVEPRAQSVELRFGTVEIPLGPLPGYIKRRVDVGRMSLEQSQRLGEITSGLQFRQATLKNGTFVRTELHAIRWLLENLRG